MKKEVKLVLIVVVAFFTLLTTIYAYRYFTAPVKGIVDAQEKIHKGNNRIQKYDYFFDMCARAQELSGKLDAQYEQLNMTTNEKSKSRILTNITGIKGEFQRVVRTYNSDARKNYTDGQFRSSKLPFQLQTNYVKGGNVSCVN